MHKTATVLANAAAADATARNQNERAVGREELAAVPISEFCRQHSISRGTFYNIRADGTGPKQLHVRGRVLITQEAALEWRLRAA
jgi:hypothetical protein